MSIFNQLAAKQLLWCIGESTTHLNIDRFEGSIITNRYDVFQQMKEKCAQVFFNDFILDEIIEGTLIDQIYFYLNKEKKINLHLLRSFTALSSIQTLIFEGTKQEGFKSIVSAAQKIGLSVKVTRHKNQLFTATVTKSSSMHLPIDNYNKKIPLKNTQMVSKPGCYGFNKIDRGSELLITTFADWLKDKPTPKTLLDLGCGYGFLSVESHHLGIEYITATDNSAAALLCCQYNFRQLNIQGEVIASDCGDKIKKQFDIILCNPPFHRGFNHDKTLIQQFILSAKRLSTVETHLFFVVNQFIGIEKIARNHFTVCQEVGRNHGYKVLLLK